MRPLEGVKVLDFGQFLSAPSATLRLADMGATVIKVERPGGDICRQMYISNCKIEGESTLFHAINRNKDDISLDLKSEKGQRKLEEFVKNADIIVVNFRPGVADKLGLSYERIKKMNPKIIYGNVTGYGPAKEWSREPGQDILVQSLAGIPYLNGNATEAPAPMGLSLADMFCGQHLVQGLLAALIRREKTGEGALIEVSLLESILDVQVEVLTTYLNDGKELPVRSAVNNANAYINAPYGIYATKDGYLALAMVSIVLLGQLLDCKKLTEYTDEKEWATKRDEIKAILRDHLLTDTTGHWLSILEKEDIWCAKVLNWSEFFETEAFQVLGMTQPLERAGMEFMQTTRCPITIDGEYYYSTKAAPAIGQDNVTYGL